MRRQYTERPPEFEIYDGYHPFKNGLAFAGLGRFTGSTLYYDSSHGNNGTLTNMDPATDWVPALGRMAIDSTGATNVIVLPSTSLNFVNGSAYTLAIWVKIANSASNRPMLARRASPGSYQFDFRKSGANVISLLRTGGAITGSAIPDNLWTHCAVSIATDGTGFFAINGVGAGAVTYVSITGINTTPTIGNWADASATMGGQHSDPCVWNRNLSLVEILALADSSNVMLRLGGSDFLRYRPRRSRIYFSGAAAQRWPWQQRYRRRMTGAY